MRSSLGFGLDINLTQGRGGGGIVLGPELLTNGDFSGTWTGDVPQGHIQNGTTTGTSYLVKDDINDRLGIVTDGANMGVFQAGKVAQFITYKYAIDIESVSLGAVKIQLGGDTASFNSAGMSEGFLTSATTDAAAYLSRDGACDVVINSWSVKEVL